MISRLFPLTVVLLALAASGQDWQDCKPDGDYSFKDVKAAVRRVTNTGGTQDGTKKPSTGLVTWLQSQSSTR
jgi:hypothetical protein